MNNTTKIFLFVVVAGILAQIGYFFVQKFENQAMQVATSDAKNVKGTIRIAVDSWIGYFPLCSPNLKSRMISLGYLVQCEDDQADYDSRMRKLKKGQLDFAVATVDAYLSAGKEHGFPGVIVSVIDESKGGDAIIANSDKVKSLEDLKTKEVKIAYTKNSPSEFLLKSTAVHFDIQKLLKNISSYTIEADGASDALSKLQKNEADVAVVWEPEVTKALANKKIKQLLSSKDTSRLIIDVLLANRDYAAEQPQMVKLLLSNYFRTLKYYRENPEKLLSDVKAKTDLDKKSVKAMLSGVAWQTLHSNASFWFGVSQKGKESLVGSIDSIIGIFREASDFDSNPIPDGNPYVILNSGFIKELYSTGISENDQDANSEVKFSQLSSAEWDQLEEVGTLKIRPISFQSGNEELTEEGMQELAKAVKSLDHYPNFRVVIRGHTGLRGDKEANQTLSEERANSVRDYLISKLQVDQNRLRSIGHGSSKPLPRLQGESNRAYQYRLPRVEMNLVSEVY